MSRPKRITLAPTAVDADGLATTQTITAASPALILNGALASGYDVDAIATAQTTAGAGTLTLDGAVGAVPHVLRETEERLIFTSTSDNSGIAYTITGEDKAGRNVIETVTGSAASQKVFSANSYWSIESITVDGAITGNVEVGLNGVATFTTAQHVTLTTSSDESAQTWTVTGTDRHGQALTQTSTGPNATVAVGTANFETVTHIELSDAATGVTAGVDGTCESGWIPIDRFANSFGVAVGVALSSAASLTYSVQHTFDDVQDASFTEHGATTFEHASITAATASADGNYTQPPVAVRLDFTAHSSGSAEMIVIQTE